MNKVVLGKYVNTHGLKGEIRIKSDFKYKNRVFKKNNVIFIDKPYTILTYRVHKGYDMVSLEGINSINDITFIKNSLVYIERDMYINDNEYLDNELIGYNIINSYLNIQVTGIKYLRNNKKLLEANGKLIPFELIDEVDNVNKIIRIKEVIGL